MQKYLIYCLILSTFIMSQGCDSSSKKIEENQIEVSSEEVKADLERDAALIADLECRSKNLLQSVGVDISKPTEAQIDPDDEEFRIKLTKLNSEYLALMERINRQYDTPEKMGELEEKVGILSLNCDQ